MNIKSKRAVVTTEKLKEISRRGVIWQPTGAFRRRKPFKNATHTVLELYCLCGACDKPHWVAWPRLRDAKSKMCFSCASRVKKGGPLFPLSVIRKELRKKWWHLTNIAWAVAGNEFKSFELFVDWSLNTNFKIGNKIARHSAKLPYGPDNCYWKTTGKEIINLDKNTVSIQPSIDTVVLF